MEQPLRKEPDFSSFLFVYKVGNVNVGIEVVFTFDLGIVVIKVNSSFPRRFVYDMK